MTDEWVDVPRKPKPVRQRSPSEIAEALDRALALAREAVQYSHDFFAREETDSPSIVDVTENLRKPKT